MRWLIGVVVSMMLVLPAAGVQPDEVLSDPALEGRARAISAELRCLVCQNESIDDSSAPLARDLRILVRERLKNGETDRQVVDFVVARYGEFVRLRPVFAPHTLLLWLAPLVILMLGVFVVLRSAMKAGAGRAEPLTPEEKARLDAALRDDDAG